eukprot:CAMPEP_0172721700 /NCGR_PEP_ID=MMETSP1074-20121228/79698_1 /TAXON_ID=2916 /ORGANISM="Ceratium fusus, Strain PA161109" /LENGTH=70 /DNA_ID=CAMNT_0013547503 /DNA_START=85 /DNA_END=297 /DNA_ORIENTATION=+
MSWTASTCLFPVDALAERSEAMAVPGGPPTPKRAQAKPNSQPCSVASDASCFARWSAKAPVNSMFSLAFR